MKPFCASHAIGKGTRYRVYGYSSVTRFGSRNLRQSPSSRARVHVCDGCASSPTERHDESYHSSNALKKKTQKVMPLHSSQPMLSDITVPGNRKLPRNQNYSRNQHQPRVFPRVIHIHTYCISYQVYLSFDAILLIDFTAAVDLHL